MARKKFNGMITLNSWQECDDALRAIGEHRRDILAIENVMNEQIAAARAAAADKGRPLREQVAQLELALQDYAMSHRDDMDGKRSKRLTFGTVGFRCSTRVSLPKGKDAVMAIIKRLILMGMSECITRPDPRIDKEALKKYGPDRVAELGATLITEDAFGYEVNMEQLRD